MAPEGGAAGVPVGGDPLNWSNRAMVRKALIRIVATGLAVGGLTPAPAPAQQTYGRWWWEATLGGDGRSVENQVAGRTVSEIDERELRLDLGLNGFIIDPMVAQFRLGVDVALTSIEGGQSLDSDRLGYRGDLSILPRGAYPLRLSFRRDTYDYSDLSEEAPLTLLGVPDVQTSYSGRLRLRRGWFAGTLVGVEHSQLDFMEASADPQILDRQFVDWSGSGSRIRHHLRLERNFRDYGLVDYEEETLTFSVDERGEIAPGWDWLLYGLALQRDLAVRSGAEAGVDSLRLRTQVVHPVRGDDVLNLSYDGGMVGGTRTPTSTSHTLRGRYVWRLKGGWQLAPFAAVAVRDSDGSSLVSPQLGLSTTWGWQRGGFDGSLSSAASYLLADRGDGGGNDSALGLSLGADLGYGSQETLRSELELLTTRNELRTAGETVSDLPDLGGPIAGAGIEDMTQGRLTFRRRIGRLTASLFTEASRRESSADRSPLRFTVDSMTHNLQLSGSRFGLLATAGDNRVEQAGFEPQTVTFATASLQVRPWRLLTLQGSYRIDDREVAFAPDVKGERIQAGFTLQLGAFFIEALAFSTSERLDGGGERTNEGIKWSITRRFAGWLPIVTGTQRRGVIR